ncbi:MAG: AMP-binding protein [Rhodoglobus sp.]
MSSENESVQSAWGVWEWARVQPDRVAIETEKETVSFGELAGRANQLSRALRDLGIGREDVVAAIVRNDKEYFQLVLAASQIGAYLLAMNWHLTPDETTYILKDSGAKVLIAEADLGEALSHVSAELPELRFAIGADISAWGRFGTLGVRQPSDDIDDRQYGAVMGYTSGTTGRPKGVRRVLPQVSPEEGLGFFKTMLAAFGLNSADGRHLLCSPAYHAAPSGFALGILNMGQTVVIHDRFLPEKALHAITNEGITSSHMVPTHFHRMLMLPDDQRESADFSGLVALVHAGAPCPPEIKREMLEWAGPIVWEYLGATEGLVSIASPQTWLEHPETVGKPLQPGAVVIKRDDGTDADDGEEGTIYFATPTPFEYHNDPEKTAASRLDGRVTVGDIGVIDDEGYVYLLDRRTDLIVSGGVNIYPAEVEGALITHDSVLDIGVIGVTDREWGRSVVAVIQLAPGFTGDADLVAQLEEHAREKLPSYKRPRRYEFLAEFPRTEAGKVRRRDLREIYDPERTPTTAILTH